MVDEKTLEEAAKIAFEAHSAVSGVSLKWNALPPHIKAAWKGSVMQVLRYLAAGEIVEH